MAHDVHGLRPRFLGSTLAGDQRFPGLVIPKGQSASHQLGDGIALGVREVEHVHQFVGTVFHTVLGQRVFALGCQVIGPTAFERIGNLLAEYFHLVRKLRYHVVRTTCHLRHVGANQIRTAHAGMVGRTNHDNLGRGADVVFLAQCNGNTQGAFRIERQGFVNGFFHARGRGQARPIGKRRDTQRLR